MAEQGKDKEIPHADTSDIIGKSRFKMASTRTTAAIPTQEAATSEKGIELSEEEATFDDGNTETCLLYTSGTENTLLPPDVRTAIRASIQTVENRCMYTDSFPSTRPVSYTHLDVYKRQVFRYTVRFSEEEHNRFLSMFEKSGVYAKSVFLKAHFFGQPFKVLKVDKTLVDYYTKLSDFHAQFRAIGTNYNQVVKELRLHFSEKKAMALLYKLEQQTVELVKLSRKIVELSREMQEKWSQKSV